ncbi:MAG: hypothetical protein JNL21_35240 [Myxococcales bacterium]|nr:hypothetical protein [Myxococcales bacterium]
MKIGGLVRAVLLVAVVGVSGCDEDVAPYVPDGVVMKDDLYGEWYAQVTFADAAVDESFVFEGIQATAGLVRWEVQEALLVGYRAYEIAPGRDAESLGGDGEAPVSVERQTGGLPPGTRCFATESGIELPCVAEPDRGVRAGYAGEPGVTCRDPEGEVVACFPYRGDPLLAYPIEKHFDLVERDGALVEDTSRPWSQRGFIRVDWSRNVVSGTELNPTFRVRNTLDDPTVATSTVEETVGGHDGFRRVDDGLGGLEGIEWTSRVVMNPPTVEYEAFPYTQRYPYCFFEGYDGLSSCLPTELRLRTTLRRAPREPDFEAAVQDARDQLRFPLYGARAEDFDAAHEARLSEEVLKPFRFNLWRQTFQRDSSGRFVRDDDGRRVAIPIEEREVAEVRYHLTGPWPDSAIAAAERAVAAYDGVLREAVAFLQPARSHEGAVMKLSFNGRRKLVPVAANPAFCDAAIASGRAESARLADGEAACALADYDPVEDAPIHDAVVEWADHPEGNVARVGDLRHHVLNWVERLTLVGVLGYGPTSADPRTGESLQASVHLYGSNISVWTTDLVDRINLTNGFGLQGWSAGSDLRTAVEQQRFADAFRNLAAEVADAPIERGVDMLLGSEGAARLAAMRPSGLAALRTTSVGPKALASALTESPTLAATFTPEGAAAPSTLGARSAGILDLEDGAGFTGCRLDATSGLSVAAVASRYAGAPIVRGDAAWLEVHDAVAAWVVLHEMGHNFALRHNFNASHDALNYPPQFWQSRKEALRAEADLETTGDFLEMTAALDAVFREEGPAYSSVMDYLAIGGQVSAALGRFDRAAILHNLAEAAEVFDWAPSEVPLEVRALLRAAGSPASRGPTVGQQIHYTQLPYLLGDGDRDLGIERLGRRKLVPRATIDRDVGSTDAVAPLVVPYGSCTDGHVNHLPDCQRYDVGPDDYSTVRTTVDEHRLSYFLMSLRNDLSYLFRESVWQFDVTVFDRLQFVFGHGLAQVLSQRRDAVSELSWAAATAISMSHLFDLATKVEYGSYTFDPANGVYLLSSYELGAGDVDVLPGVGRREADRGRDTGSVSGRLEYDEVGHATTRLVAVQSLGWSLPYDTYWDGGHGKLHVSYAELFPEAVERVVTGLYLYDVDTVAPHYVPETGKIVFPDLLSSARPQGYPLLPALSADTRNAVVASGFALLREGQSTRFVERAHVFRVAGAEEVAPAPGYVLGSVTVPSTGVAYGALIPEQGSFGLAAQYMSFAESQEAAFLSLPEGDPERSYYATNLLLLGIDFDYLRWLYGAFAGVNTQ